MNLRLVPLLGTLLGAMLLIGSGPAHSADTTCNGSLTGTIAGNVVVPAGAGCTLYQARISGNVQAMQNATLLVQGQEEWTSIGGNVLADGCASAVLDGSVSVAGNVQIQGCQQTSGFTGPGIKIRGNFLCQNNPGGCKAALGEVDGNIQIINNKSPVASDVSLTAIGGSLQCQQNAPAPTHAAGGNWVAGRSLGQCGASAGFAAAPFACSTLAGLALPDTTISVAQTYGAGDMITGTVKAPVALCRIAGTINPSTNPSQDSNIRFEVWLPLANWTGRFEQVGNGGSAGSIRYVFDIGSLSQAVTNGNAAASTDDGTSVPSGSPAGIWQYGHPQKQNDAGYRAVHRTNLNGRVLTTAFYGESPSYKYFKGCSKGGGEGLMEAQRYPEDFDGIMIGAVTNGLPNTAGVIWTLQHVSNPTYNPAGVIPNSPTLLAAVTGAVQAACAAIKTVPTDSSLSDPRQCQFDARQIFGGILTPQQIASIRAVYDGPVTSFGVRVSPGFEPGNEAQTWPGLIVGAAAPTGPAYAIQQTPATFDVLRDYNIDTSPAYFETFPIVPASPGSTPQTLGSSINATNPDLSAFKARGGRLIYYQGWQDNQVQPQHATDYFESVVTFEENNNANGKGGLGETQSYFRLFMAPGMSHCRGGPGLNEFGRNGGAGPASHDLFTALYEWVEHGKAPKQVIGWNCTNQVASTATTCSINQSTLSRPLCPYPQKAVYIGAGSTSDAANFVCQ